MRSDSSDCQIASVGRGTSGDVLRDDDKFRGSCGMVKHLPSKKRTVHSREVGATRHSGQPPVELIFQNVPRSADSVVRIEIVYVRDDHYVRTL